MTNTNQSAIAISICKNCKCELKRIYAEIDTPIRYFYIVDSTGNYTEEEDYELGAKESYIGMFCGECHKELQEEQVVHFHNH